MNLLSGNEAFETYAVCSAILVIKMIASAVYTGTQRNKVKGYVNPEDAKLGGAGAEAATDEKPEVARALRIQRNDLENIPLFFAIGLVYVLSGASAFGAAAYCWTFTLARIAHTVVYARGMQPARAICWGIGLLANVGMAVNVIWKNL
jgi:uncharacterized MAPEG superfamily protein